MRRVVIDTNVYIHWINRGSHEEVVFQRETVKYLSAVVLMELRAGAFSTRDLRLLQRLQTAFERAGRLLTPPSTVFAEAGDVLRQLQAERGYNIAASRSIANDVLIALSARSIGAAVLTQNERDYRAIQAIRPFRLLIASLPDQRAIPDLLRVEGRRRPAGRSGGLPLTEEVMQRKARRLPRSSMGGAGSVRTRLSGWPATSRRRPSSG